MAKQLSSNDILQLNNFLIELMKENIPEELKSKERLIKKFIRNTIQKRTPEGMDEVGIIISATLIKIFKEKDYQYKDLIKILTKTLDVISNILIE